MKIKEGANIQGINIRIRPALAAADQIWKQYDKNLVVTCGLDGEHSAGSLHYYGLAVDLRTNYFTETAAQQVRQELANALGDDYDVVYHAGSHMHVEYDPT